MMARVLKPGGPASSRRHSRRKAARRQGQASTSIYGRAELAGALLEAELQATVVAAGFVGFEITARVDVYANAPQSGSAAKFGTLGINFRARKPLADEEWHTALAALRCAAG
jgi:hypothetical protein